SCVLPRPACWLPLVCPCSARSRRRSPRPTRGCPTAGRCTRSGTTPPMCCTPCGRPRTPSGPLSRDLADRPSFCPVSSSWRRGRMLSAHLGPTALQHGLAVGGDVVSAGPECPRRSRFQPQPVTGVGLVDAVIRAQQRPHRILIIADDRGGNCSRGGEQFVGGHPF